MTHQIVLLSLLLIGSYNWGSEPLVLPPMLLYFPELAAVLKYGPVRTIKHVCAYKSPGGSVKIQVWFSSYMKDLRLFFLPFFLFLSFPPLPSLSICLWFVFLRLGLTSLGRLELTVRPGWSRTCSTLPASVSFVLDLQVSITTLSMISFLIMATGTT